MEETKRKRTSHKISSTTRGDIVSNLPESLISQILIHLPTKEAVRTSVLSKRWRTLWFSISELSLDSRDEFPNYVAFANFIEKFLKKLTLEKLKLTIIKCKNDPSCLNRWIHFVATRNTIKHLVIEHHYACPKRLEVVPLSLYVCETLLHLKLNRVMLPSFKSVALPRLKTMCLDQNVYSDKTGMELLISSCPVLEDISIVRRLDDNVLVLRVVSKTITSLMVGFDRGFHGLFCFDRYTLGLFVNAPRLKCLSLDHEWSPNKTLSNLVSLVKVNIVDDLGISYYGDPRYEDLSKSQMVRNFFIAISKAKDLIISRFTMELIYDYSTKVEPLPEFRNLSSLEVEISYRRIEILNFLPTLLEMFPNLKSIVVDLSDISENIKPITASSLPQCLLSSLEFVEIKSGNHSNSVEVAKYFARNSAILKRLVLWRCRASVICRELREVEDFVLRDLLASLNQPSACQIEVCGP